MRDLNYHHLKLVLAVAREGSVSAAARVLHLTQPTVSAQIKSFELHLGHRLFIRDGRKLMLTQQGEVVQRYAESIFSLGEDLLDALEDRQPGHYRHYVVGVADVLPKLLSVRLLEPIVLDERVRLVCHEDPPERLVTRIESHAINLVLSDAPAMPSLAPRAISQLLGHSQISWFGTTAFASRLRPGFPYSLDQAPVLLPQHHNTLRRSLERWFGELDIRPVIVGEFDDSAMLKAFGADGFGVFPAPTVVSEAICYNHHVEDFGIADGVLERLYAIFLPSEQGDPAMDAVFEAADRVLIR